MSLPFLAVVFAGFFSAALSALAGLGGGTVLIAVFFALGLSPAVAVPLFSAVQFVSNLSRTLAYLRHVRWRALGWYAVVGVPAPFLLAPMVVHAQAPWIELLLALLILASLPLGRGSGALLPERASFFAAGLLNGVVGTFVGATGLLVGRLFLRPEWPRQTLIATIAVTMTLGHLLRVLAFALASRDTGQPFLPRLDWLLPLIAAVILGTLFGRRLNRRLDERSFQRLFRALLLLLSLKLLFDALRGLWP